MKRAGFLMLLVLASCRHPAPVEAVRPAPAPVKMPFPAVLWKTEQPLDVDPNLLLEKDGVLKRVPPASGDDEGRTWPFAIDYWGITRTDAEAQLSPWVGHAIRVRGHYKKIDVHGSWRYEVDPEKIVLLPDATATPSP